VSTARTARFRLRPQARGARLALDAALATLARAGRSTPCQRDPEPFTSEWQTEREDAAAACALCPVRRPCALYAAAASESHHTWGGVDRGS